MQQLDWKLGWSGKAASEPVKWVTATVPGAVQLDVARAENYPPFELADNYKQFRWCEDQYWHYRSEFSGILEPGQQLFFVSKGIDYAFAVFLNGEEIHAQEGMFTPVELDLTDRLAESNELRIVICPAPKLEGMPDDRSQADRSCKPAVSYEWDWHPRLIPLGIWDDTFLETRSAIHICDVQVDYGLDDTLSTAQINVHAELSGAANYVWELLDPAGAPVLQSTGYCDGNLEFSAELDGVELWWPREHGAQNLYTARLKVDDGAWHETAIGFRTVRLIPNTVEKQPGFPKTREAPPATLEVNGQSIFLRGTNWVNPEIFWGTITDARYEELLELAQDINFNILRVWGGAIVNKDFFHDWCDRHGMLVWQDFPLACNPYEGTPDYLRVLKQEASSIIKRLRHHASLAIWCGGNELFNDWSGMNDQSAALRLLGSLCFEQTPEIPFIATSPLMGMGHGPYLFKDTETGEEVFSQIARRQMTAYPEFGNPSVANLQTLEKCIPPDELFPPRPGGAWEAHHAYGAWDAAHDTWMMLETQRSYFGEPDNLEELIERSQLLQSMGYKCIYEEARRQKPFCSMALNWCFNEPWPTAANNSLVCYPADPKSSYYAVQASCRPTLASARVGKFVWEEGECFECDLFLLNDLLQAFGGSRVAVRLVGGNTETILDWDYAGLEPDTNLPGPTARFRLPRWEGISQFRLVLEVSNHPEWNSEYVFLYRLQSVCPAQSGARELNV